MVQSLRLCTSTLVGVGFIPCLGTKIPHALEVHQRGKKDMLYFRKILGYSIENGMGKNRIKKVIWK